MAQNNDNGKMSREEAGRLDGEATAKKGREFYQEIGKKGGESQGQDTNSGNTANSNSKDMSQNG